MNILIINASPKRKGGASRFLSVLLKLALLGHDVTTCDVRNRADYDNAYSLLEIAGAVVISSPLYIDGIPSHMLPFLVQVERQCREKHYRFKLYVLSNSGFIEGRQNALHLSMYEAWCVRADIEWGGGLGIGGGVMLHVISILFPISLIINCVEIAVIVAQKGVITSGELLSQVTGLLITLFIASGPFVYLFALARSIRGANVRRNLYIRPLMPSFLFVVVADIFMLISAIIKGTLPHKLMRRAGTNEN